MGLEPGCATYHCQTYVSRIPFIVICLAPSQGKSSPSSILTTLLTVYRAGIITPSNTEPHPSVCPGVTFAAEEEHRPSKLDMFLRFDRLKDLPVTYPLEYTPIKTWPDLRSCAREFAQGKQATGTVRAAAPLVDATLLPPNDWVVEPAQLCLYEPGRPGMGVEVRVQGL